LLDLSPKERADGEGAREQIPIARGDAVVNRVFHSRTATRHFCTVCGNYPFHRKRVTPQFLAINVYCLDDFDPAGIPVRATRGRMTK
jgi:hypothetical protein